ncbi:MAG TPA: flagellar basal-body MS-ring/collar protein FliF, partial [Rhizobium sp.]|nr:flagellar basal-body MS-ring/collar protein FliF [Rhizobium sp.]
MNLLNQSLQIFKNLASLGQTKLLTLAGVGVVSIAIIIAAALFVNKPAYETLYTGLEATDLNQVSIALAEAGIDFEVGTDGQSIKVPAGMTSKARLLLAEHGLPNSANAGYELFDNVGSLGLTSFMQEVTRVRALEGEVARTIQQINGIAAARVHIVLPDVGNFRRGEQKPTASVMIRAGNEAGRKAAASIRHLVASAVPGLDVEDVTILDSTGQLLASGDETGGPANRSIGVVQTVQQEIESNIDKALAPFLGMDNFRSSVTAQINTDTQQIQETIYDPESRVERSIRVVKENQKSQQRQPDSAATVEQNLPQADVQ